MERQDIEVRLALTGLASLTDEQWAVIEPVIEAERDHATREAMRAGHLVDHVVIGFVAVLGCCGLLLALGAL